MKTKSNLIINIELTRGFVCSIDNVDKDLSESKWKITTDGYVALSNWRQWTSMHRLIYSRILGRELTRDEIVDHINGNKRDNRRSNLRLATYSGNTSNSKKRITNTSGYKGVTWHKQCQKWQASVKKDGKGYYLGLFDDPREAHKAYRIKAVELFGEFARFE